jgi:hypothetical protein
LLSTDHTWAGREILVLLKKAYEWLSLFDNVNLLLFAEKDVQKYRGSYNLQGIPFLFEIHLNVVT